MKTYKIKVDAEVMIQAFSAEDAMDYLNDIIFIDDEVISVFVQEIKEIK